MEDKSALKNGISQAQNVQNMMNSDNKSITIIPEQYFEEILAIWDIFTCCSEIVNDILIQTEGEEGSELRQVSVNIGNVAHFEKFFKDYFLQISIVDLYECFHNPEQNHFYSDLLLFLCSFYLKQIFEDAEQENTNIKMHNNCLYILQYKNCEFQKGSLWQLLNYLWFRDKEAYFSIIQEKVYELPVEIQEYGILHLEEDFNELKLDNSLDERLSLVKTIADGITDLKKTSALLQFRTETILLANRQRQSLSKDIRDKRGKLAQIAEDISVKEQSIKELALKIEQSDDLTRLETCRLNKQIDGIQKEIQKQKNLSNKEQNNMDDLQEQYDSLQKISSLQLIPQLLHNPSIYLGSDLKESHYYFFLHENSKIFIKLKSGQWSLFEKQEQIERIIKQLNSSSCSCEQNLKQNLQNLLKHQIYNEETEARIPVEESKNFSTQEAEFPSTSAALRKKIVNQTLMIEAELTDYLAQNRSRWLNLEERRIFRQRFHSALDQSDAQFLENVSELLSKFLERTVIQEKLEIRENSEVDVEESEGMEIEDEREFNQQKLQKNQEQKNRRRVVEDESDETYNNPVYNNSEFQQLEQLDPQKLIVKKIPLRLFGTQNDLLRQCCIDLAKSNLASLADLMLLITVIEKTVSDCLERKREKVQPINEVQKQKQEIQQQVTVASQAPQLKTTSLRTTRSKQRIQSNGGCETQWEEFCKVCHQRGKLICCDTCPSVFHAKCLGLKQIPQGKWSCFRCLSRMEAQIKTRATLKKLQQ